MRTTVRVSAIPDHAAVATLPEVEIDERCLEGDRTVLGSMALSGLNLRVDSQLQELVPGGPYPAPANIAA